MNRTSKKARRIKITASDPRATPPAVSGAEYAASVKIDRRTTGQARQYALTAIGSAALPGIGTLVGKLADYGIGQLEEALYGADERALADHMSVNDAALAVYDEVSNLGAFDPRKEADEILAGQIGYWPYRSRARRPRGAWHFNDDNRRVGDDPPLPPRVTHFGSASFVMHGEPVDTRRIWEAPVLARFPMIKRDSRGGFMIDVEHWDFARTYSEAAAFADQVVRKAQADLPTVQAAYRATLAQNR